MFFQGAKMKSLTLNFADCIYEKNFTNGIKEKTLLSTKMEKMCKKHIVNKTNKNANFTDLPFQNKQEIKDIQLFGTKISRLYSRFILVGEESILSGIKAIQSFHNSIIKDAGGRKEKDAGERNGEIDFEVVRSENVDRLQSFLDSQDLNKTFFNFVLTNESDLATLSLFSLTIAKLKEVLKEDYFVNLSVTTKDDSKLWTFCAENKINTMKFPKNICEKYCTLSPVGLFPMAVLNINLEKVLEGAKQILENFKQENAENSLSFASALINYNFYQLKKRQVVMITRDANLHNFIKHFENISQVYDGMSGEKIVMFMKFAKENSNIKLPKLNKDINLPKSLQELDDVLYFATRQSLKEKGTPNYSLIVNEKTDKTTGQLLFFFELTAVIMQELFKANVEFDVEGNIREKVKLSLSQQKYKEEKNGNFEINN